MNLIKFANTKLIVEATVDGSKVQMAMDKIIKYIENKLGHKLVRIPGVEHFHNSNNHGYGYRFVFSGSTKCIRLNWSTEPKNGKMPTTIQSIDIFTGKHDPSFTIHTKGISFAQTLPTLVQVLDNPTVARLFVFPVSPEEAVTEAVLLEVARDAYSTEQALSDFLKQLTRGKTFTRSEFIGSYHIVHAGIFDTVFKEFKDKFQVDAKRVSLKPGTQIDSLKDSILSKAGVIEVTGGGSKEVFLKTSQEEAVEAAGSDRVPFGDALEHLEGLVEGTIKGAFNALFVAGKGGTGKTQTVEKVLKRHGMSRGNGYYRIAGSASAAGIYPFLYHHKNDIILFDDCDGALQDQDARNLIKGATDTQKVRELSWLKKASFTYDDTDEEMSEDTRDALQSDVEKAPKSFKFTGRVIFISNLPLAKLDPDGALRTRAFIINIDPTDEEMFAHMEKILFDIDLEEGFSLTKEERYNVLKVVKTSKRKGDVNLRKLVRSLNMAASGVPNWAVLVDLYA